MSHSGIFHAGADAPVWGIPTSYLAHPSLTLSKEHAARLGTPRVRQHTEGEPCSAREEQQSSPYLSPLSRPTPTTGGGCFYPAEAAAASLSASSL
jgi:hypothetical protein